MIKLIVTVDDITNIMASGYTVIRVYTDTTESGGFTTLDGTITLVAGNTGYEYIDTDGTSALWYKVCYYGSGPGESEKSDARKGETFAAYGTVTQLKGRLGIPDDEDDHMLGLMLDAISRSIDAETGTRFYTTTSDEVRKATAEFADELWCGDLLSLTTLETDGDGDRVYEDTWTSGDYDLLPFNAALDHRPYRQIAVAPNGDYTFPVGMAGGVQLTGTWGYCTEANRALWAPQVGEACLLAAERLFSRKDAIFGIVGTPGLGELRHIITETLTGDKEISMLLYGFMRSVGPVAV